MRRCIPIIVRTGLIVCIVIVGSISLVCQSMHFLRFLPLDISPVVDVSSFSNGTCFLHADGRLSYVAVNDTLRNHFTTLDNALVLKIGAVGDTLWTWSSDGRIRSYVRVVDNVTVSAKLYDAFWYDHFSRKAFGARRDSIFVILQGQTLTESFLMITPYSTADRAFAVVDEGVILQSDTTLYQIRGGIVTDSMPYTVNINAFVRLDKDYTIILDNLGFAQGVSSSTELSLTDLSMLWNLQWVSTTGIGRIGSNPVLCVSGVRFDSSGAHQQVALTVSKDEVIERTSDFQLPAQSVGTFAVVDDVAQILDANRMLSFWQPQSGRYTPASRRMPGYTPGGGFLTRFNGDIGIGFTWTKSQLFRDSSSLTEIYDARQEIFRSVEIPLGMTIGCFHQTSDGHEIVIGDRGAAVKTSTMATWALQSGISGASVFRSFTDTLSDGSMFVPGETRIVFTWNDKDKTIKRAILPTLLTPCRYVLSSSETIVYADPFRTVIAPNDIQRDSISGTTISFDGYVSGIPIQVVRDTVSIIVIPFADAEKTTADRIIRRRYVEETIIDTTVILLDEPLDVENYRIAISTWVSGDTLAIFDAVSGRYLLVVANDHVLSKQVPIWKVGYAYNPTSPSGQFVSTTTVRYVSPSHGVAVDINVLGHDPDSVTSVDGLNSQVTQNIYHVYVQNVSPNPASTTIHANLGKFGTADLSSLELFISDLEGNIVQNCREYVPSFGPGSDTARVVIPISSLASGIYLLVFRNSQIASSHKFIVVR